MHGYCCDWEKGVEFVGTLLVRHCNRQSGQCPNNCRSNAFGTTLEPLSQAKGSSNSGFSVQVTDGQTHNGGRSDGQRQTTCLPRSARSPELVGTGTWCCLAVGIGSPNASFAPFLQALIHGPTKFRVLLLHLQQSLLVVEPLCPARGAVELQAHL